MKDHPILFSGPMVQAILDGRKTMTRRVVDRVYQKGLSVMTTMPKSPYGYPGDRLWVRETWSINQMGGMADGDIVSHDYEVKYRADGQRKEFSYEGPRTETDPYLKYYDTQRGEWRPSIFMPRWASRILLEIEDVRVQWLQDISEADATAEGCPTDDYQNFRMLWDSINKKRGFGWDTNPGVWVVKFNRL